MDNTNARAEEQTLAPETPEDVAILYSWANLPGAKYRDFSASRREYRAQQRARAAEAQRQAELQAARGLEEAAQREIQEAQRQLEARQAEAKAVEDAEAKRRAEEVMRRAEERAEQERQEALRRQQSAEELRVLAERAQEEMLEARKRAEEQAARYAEADAQSRMQGDQQARVLPGETSDPYYYTGPVDPAYFASTPGVRTAQAARVSTERKAYVYPMHPGSDEYDSGTIVTYRPHGQFAPSPAQHGAARIAPLIEEMSEGTRSLERERALSLDENPGKTSELDDTYYDGGRTTRLFAPSPLGRYTEQRESASADLHIRPASRVSGDHMSPARAIRPSPVSQAPSHSTGASMGALLGQVDSSGVAMRRGEPIPSGTTSFFRAADGESRRDLPLRETTDALPVAAEEEAGVPPQRPEDGDNGKVWPIRYEEATDETDESRSSRMFIPSPRRRVLQAGPAASPVAERPGEPNPEEVRLRDAAAREGHRRSQNEVDSRGAQDRFVQRQESEGPAGAGRLADERTASMPKSATPPETETRVEEPVHWRSVNRIGEAAQRRRRLPGSEPIARTERQPRAVQDTEFAVESPTSGEPAAPPAWLSAERPVARATDSSADESVALSAGLPAAPGDPNVPTPRPVIRRQPSGLRPRASAPPAPSASNEQLLVPADVAAQEKPAQEQRRDRDEPLPAEAQATATDTLQQSRERVASRWFALSGIMGSESRPNAENRVSPRSVPHPAPMLCVLSISGGVGKTSIVATLGRALSSLGEKVMLADTNVHGILPYYFGAREQRPGAVRTFSPPPGSSDAPVVLVSYDADGRGYDEAGQARVLDDLYRRANEVQRVLVDAGVNSAWLARTVAGTNPWVLVPVAPDMNSVLGTQAVERLFQDVTGADGRPVKPYYVLNQYDPAMPLHLDVREVLRQFLGDRLLPIMLHRTPAVSEALAEGMTVIDYAPRSPIANDYMNLATWVRRLADPGLSYAPPARWSER